MKCIKYAILAIGFGSCLSAVATELFVLNKTGAPLRYELYYNYANVFGKESVERKTQETAPNRFGRIKSRTLKKFILRDQLGNVLPIVSFSGDPRITAFCNGIKLKGWTDNMFSRHLKPKITPQGELQINQNIILSQEARPLVIAVTKSSGGRYILTELNHTKGIRLFFRGPSPITYAIQAMPTPA